MGAARQFSGCKVYIASGALCAAALAVWLSALRVSPIRADEAYDVVIAHGQVMDPESGLNEIRSVGITGGKIRAISAEPLRGRQTIDASGLIVAPGFIDPHEHGQEPRNYEFQAHDGVTTSLELEGGTADVDGWYAQREGKTLINYGASIGHIGVRSAVLVGGGNESALGAKANPEQMAAVNAAAHREASADEVKEIAKRLERGLERGALAEGMGINYNPGASRAEIVEMFRVAAKHGAPVHVHLRYSSLLEPETGAGALQEVIADAAMTGAPLHVVHITSMGLRFTPLLIEMVAGAQRGGVDVTTECYPYTASSTYLQSAIFDEGWQQKYGITYHDLQWAETGERLTAETFAKYRKQGGVVVIHEIPEEAARAAVSSPLVMIGSDGMPITGPKIHPRGQGTFARVLGHYVREEKALNLMTALRKMTLMPAQRLEKHAPAFRDKGRVRVGADADLTIFDPEKIIDRASFEEPLQFSAGIPYVLVHGVLVVQNGQTVSGVFPGRAARAPIQPN